jgi:hypothetical protein
MWSPPGSGFEASSFSPAGRAQQRWALVGGVRSHSRRQTRAVRLMLLVVLVAVLLPLVIGAIAVVLG